MSIEEFLLHPRVHNVTPIELILSVLGQVGYSRIREEVSREKVEAVIKKLDLVAPKGTERQSLVVDCLVLLDFLHPDVRLLILGEPDLLQQQQPEDDIVQDVKGK